jgi:hypothetical protein
MAVNNITDETTPTLVANPATIEGQVVYGGATAIQDRRIDCAAHHAPNQGAAFPSLNFVGITDTVCTEDTTSLKHSLNSIANNWSRGVSNPDPRYKQASNQSWYIPKITLNAIKGNVAYKYEWDQMVSVINSFSTFGIASISRPAEIEAAFYNNIINNYISIADNCLCNSDCACNNVCTCNTDCGCNYSDRRLKIEINHIGTVASNKIKSKTPIKFYSFYYVDGTELGLDLPKEKQFGVMAQDLIRDGLSIYVINTEEYFQVDYDALYRDIFSRII